MTDVFVHTSRRSILSRSIATGVVAVLLAVVAAVLLAAAFLVRRST